MDHPGPPLSEHRLRRVLGLSQDAGPAEVGAALPHLITRLRNRLESADSTEANALRREIEAVERASASLLRPEETQAASGSGGPTRGMLRGLLGAALIFVLLIAYAAGYRITRRETGAAPGDFAESARLILDGRLAGATLRVLDSDREELFFKLPAQNAGIDLVAGRYALDVSREDCPDHWTRSVYFEEGATHRFEPILCVGEGELTVRSNVARDRLRIDGLDIGSTREEPHPVGVGDHEIRVEKAGYIPFVGTIRMRPDEELTLRVELIATSEAGSIPGRPIPVERVSPATPPAPPISADSFAPPIATDEFVPQKMNLPLMDPDPGDELFSTRDRTGGGSTRWHDRMSRNLLTRYDLDDSGQIDRLAESEPISCAVWLEIERDFDGGGLGLSMVRYYGFDGSEWHPNALGFSQAHRSAVFEKMKECGLKT